MDNIFGVPMNSIMLVLVVLLGLALAVVAYVAARNRIMFLIGVRNIPRRRAQTILIVLGLMLSTLIISAAFTTGDTVSHSISAEAFQITGHVDEMILFGEDLDEAEFAETFLRRQPLSESLVVGLEKRLQGDEEIDGLMPVIMEPVSVLNSRTSLSEPVGVLTGVDASRLDGFPDIITPGGESVDVAALADDELLVNESMADELDAEPGDTLDVFFQNRRFPFRVAGVVQDRLLTGASFFRRLGMVTRLDVLQEAFGRQGEADFIAVSNLGGVREGMDLSDRVELKLDATLRGVSGAPFNVDPIKAEGVDTADDAGSFMVTIFVILGLFSIAAGVLLIFMIFVMLAAERKSEMGMSRALGTKRWHLVEMFIAEGMGYNLMAAMVGVALGVVVSLGMTRIMAIIFSQFNLGITFHVTWRSLIVSYSLGVVLTFLTVVFSSWRVSSLNIVRAIRDLPEPKVARAGRGALALGVAGILLGLLITWGGQSSGQLFPIAFGVSLVILGLGPVMRYVGVPERPVFTSIGVTLLVYWIVGASGNLERVVGDKDAGPEMFFLSGLVMVLAATFVLVYNADLFLVLVERFGGRMSRILPAMKTAVAYPLASKFRTGMTMAMISLVVFALVMQSTMNTNFDALFLDDDARGGWDVMVQENPSNPLGDLRTALLRVTGMVPAEYEAVGKVEVAGGFQAKLRQHFDEGSLSSPFDLPTYPVRGLDEEFLAENRIELRARATGLEDDRAVWDAMLADPSLAVIDAFSLPGGGFDFGGPDFQLEGIEEGQRTFDPIPLEIVDPQTNRSERVSLIGVISFGSSPYFFGLHTSQDTIRNVFGEPDFSRHYIRLAPGTDAKAAARAIEAALLTRGAQAESIKDEVEKQQRLQNGFFWLIQGFMGLGLLVGTAAVGVVAFRTVVERRQQIGMLRAIGYQRSTIGLSFLMESSFIALLGVLSGVGLAILLAFLLLNSEELQTQGIDTFIIPWGQIILVSGFAFGASLLMSIVPSRQAASIPIADALRYE